MTDKCGRGRDPCVLTASAVECRSTSRSISRYFIDTSVDSRSHQLQSTNFRSMQMVCGHSFDHQLTVDKMSIGCRPSIDRDVDSVPIELSSRGYRSTLDRGCNEATFSNSSGVVWTGLDYLLDFVL